LNKKAGFHVLFWWFGTRSGTACVTDSDTGVDRSVVSLFRWKTSFFRPSSWFTPLSRMFSDAPNFTSFYTGRLTVIALLCVNNSAPTLRLRILDALFGVVTRCFLVLSRFL